jgi:hypothetical protein
MAGRRIAANGSESKSRRFEMMKEIHRVDVPMTSLLRRCRVAGGEKARPKGRMLTFQLTGFRARDRELKKGSPPERVIVFHGESP